MLLALLTTSIVRSVAFVHFGHTASYNQAFTDTCVYPKFLVISILQKESKKKTIKPLQFYFLRHCLKLPTKIINFLFLSTSNTSIMCKALFH